MTNLSLTNYPNISRLAAITGPSLSRAAAEESLWRERRDAVTALMPLLSRRNGFYAFYGALHVFPLGQPNDSDEMDMQRWNSDNLWRGHYKPFLESAVCFAEDIFGEQFCLDRDGVVRFNPETGEARPHSADVEEWAGRILNRYEFETGFLLAKAWHQTNGPVRRGKRLLPAMPFVLGGDYSLDNLFEGDAIEGMRFRSDLSHQVRNIPDGALVRFVVTER